MISLSGKRTGIGCKQAVMPNWLLRDQEIVAEGAEAVLESSRISWFDFPLVIGLSILLALFFNHANPDGIPLFPSHSDGNPIPVIGGAEEIEDYRQRHLFSLIVVEPTVETWHSDLQSKHFFLPGPCHDAWIVVGTGRR